MFTNQPKHLFPALSLLALAALSAFLLWIFRDLPNLSSLESNLSNPSIKITDREGRTLYNLIDKQRGYNTPVPLDKIPTHLKLATIATEDKNFYSNPGVDISGIIRAFWINLQGGETLAGGSTITQQVARNLILSENEQFEQTIRRKLRESWLAWRLTKEYTKDEILSLYLNQIYYGALAYGVGSAAQTYFGRSVEDLTIAECALIAGIPQGPAIYNPFVDPIAAKNRQKIVLELMLNQGFISQDLFLLIENQPLEFTPTPYPIEAPHFVIMVASQVDSLPILDNKYSSEGIVIRTTLNLDWQFLAERAISKHLESLREFKNRKSSTSTGELTGIPGGHNVNNAALVAINPVNGEILAMVGSPDYFDHEIAGAINMSISPRQPGSALKPLIYAAAFSPDLSSPYTPATMILDVNTTFVTGDNQAYVPANFDNLEHGPVSAREALASSLNIPAVITLEDVGVDAFINFASDLGISSFGNPENYDLSLALGGGEVTLLELSAAYATLANQGYLSTPFSIIDITSMDGTTLYTHEAPAQKQVIDERVAWLITDILNDNNARSLGFGLNSTLKIDRQAAVKTGTTTNFHDNWTLGYTPDIVVGVWVGNANHEPMRGVTGLSGAGPIWHQFIRESLTGIPESWFSLPDGLVKEEVCSLSGLLPTEACPYTKTEWFIDGTEPKIQDDVYKKIWIDSLTNTVASEFTPPENRFPITALNLPPQAHPWARSHGLSLVEDLNYSDGENFQVWEAFPLQITSPGDQSTYLLSNNLDPNTQRLHIEVVASIQLDQVNIWVDGNLWKSINGPQFEAWWPLTIGKHVLWAESLTDSNETLTSSLVSFTVESEN